MKKKRVVLDILLMLLSLFCIIAIIYIGMQWGTVADQVNLNLVLGANDHVSLFGVGIIAAQAVIFLVSFFRLFKK